MNKRERLELAQWINDYALKSGADQVAVSLNNQREIDIEFRNKKLEKLKESTRNSLSVDIYIDQKYSNHSTNDLKKDSLKIFIGEAVPSTKYLTKDEFRTLPDPKLYPKETIHNLEIYDPSYSQIKSSDRVEVASAIEAKAMSMSNLIISTTSWYSDVHSETVRLHSNGFLGEVKSTHFNIGAEVTVRDGEEGRPEDWDYASCRFQSDLPSPATVGEWAVNRALRKIGQDKLESGQYDMLVENRSGSRLIRMLRDPMRARNLQQKNSYLDGMLDKKIASESLTLIDDPFVHKGLGSRWFDGEGLASRRRIMIEKGILKQYFIDNYYGKKLGWEPNSGSPSNMVLETGSKTREEIIKSIERGIWVTGFIGGNFNSTTGDFSFGIVGHLIEKGEIVRPVNEMNIAGNSHEFWNHLVVVGNDPYPYSSWRIPSLLFEKVHFSGI